jgi:hypothetical protein
MMPSALYNQLQKVKMLVFKLDLHLNPAYAGQESQIVCKSIFDGGARREYVQFPASLK